MFLEETRPEPLGSAAAPVEVTEKKEKNLEDFFRLMDPEGFGEGSSTKK